MLNWSLRFGFLSSPNWVLTSKTSLPGELKEGFCSQGSLSFFHVNMGVNVCNGSPLCLVSLTFGPA